MEPIIRIKGKRRDNEKEFDCICQYESINRVSDRGMYRSTQYESCRFAVDLNLTNYYCRQGADVLEEDWPRKRRKTR
jgi:hypothetical protein